MDILNKHPRQSWSKDCSPAVYQTFKGINSLTQFKTSPGESNLVPQEIWNSSRQAVSLSPVDSGSLSSQITNASPGFIQRVSSLPGYNWVILSQKPRKGRRQRSSFLSPAKSINASNTTSIPGEVYQHFQHDKGIPSKLLSTFQQSISLPTEYCFPARSLEYFPFRRAIPFAKFIPQRSHLLLPVLDRKRVV